jgi:CoA:oxalate CoA-transferase
MIAQQPLQGVRVLDLSRVLAGPFCTMNLADLGAEVIKVEVPGRGDDSRGYPPLIPGSTDSGYYYSINRGKRSITLDLRKPEGAEILIAMAAHADVIVENFSPGTMDRFNTGYERLRAANPRIILCSISGFGQTGPMASAPAYDIVAQALGGTMSITGQPGGEPTRCGVSIGDLAAALYGVVAILAALRVRDQSGMGQHLEIAMLDCQVAWLEDALARFSATGKVPGPIGSRHPSITPFQQFRAADGYFVAGCGNEAIWQRFCDAIGIPQLKSDARLLTNADRTANHAELEPILARHFAPPSTGVLARTAGDGERSLRSDRNRRRGRRERASKGTPNGPAGRPFGLRRAIVPGSPLKTAGVGGAPDTRSPNLGEHTDEVLSHLLGYDAARLATLRGKQII